MKYVWNAQEVLIALMIFFFFAKHSLIHRFCERIKI